MKLPKFIAVKVSSPLIPFRILLSILMVLEFMFIGTALADDGSEVATATPVASPTPAHTGLTFSGFADTYYAHDFDDPDVHERPYTTLPLRNDEPRLNLGYADAKLDTEDWHGRLALQYGDSVIANYASEKYEFWRYFQEAYAGYKVNDNLWIDGGIFFSHLGVESFISRDNYTYTRSLVADYSPYYESGLRATYTLSEEWSAELLLLHGWQNITQDENPALGMQINYTPTTTTQLTYANYLGDLAGFRNFHDFYGKYDLTEKLSLAAEFDVGNQNLTHDGGNVWWNGWTFFARYKFTPKLSLGARVERYADPHQVVLQTLSGESYEAVGLSANIDYELYKGLVWRTEFRSFSATHDVFPREEHFSSGDNLILTSLAYSFDLGGLN